MEAENTPYSGAEFRRNYMELENFVIRHWHTLRKLIPRIGDSAKWKAVSGTCPQLHYGDVKVVRPIIPVLI